MHRWWLCFLIVCAVVGSSPKALASCAAPANAIERENCLPGTPESVWDINGAGDPTIQGFATDISVNAGGTIFFKVNTSATRYHFDIYRLGYYGGNGARLIAGNLTPSAHLPQTQPACLTDAATQLLDCGNWAVSGSWQVPATAVSGVYLAHVIRDDTGGDSHIVFIVRNDSSHSDILFQTSDETWQAYNDYGGHSLYGPDGEFDLSQRAFKVSYNRPFDTRNFENASWLFYAEYPMIRFLEANGYDVSYFTSVDAARNGALITNHKIYLSVGHDEYASAPKRASIEAARAAGVNLAFFSGNEFFWKTRWENSTDGSNTPFRTLVCYKETLANAILDPADPPTWTGTWRDPRFSPPADGGRPENALTGQLFRVNGFGADNDALSIQIPAADGKMRFWRNTPVAGQSTGQVWSLPGGTLGYEWDVDEDNGARPAGAIRLSTATYPLTTDYLLDFGGTYGAGTATHHMTLYRAPSGALVFGAGTVQWAWGLDADHDTLYYPGFPADPNMQQATVNLFADMGVQPATLQPGMLTATKSTDVTPPHSTITSPAAGGTVQAGTTVTVSGTAADTGGLVGGVEVSADGGQTWHPANGRENWTFAWNPKAAGTATLMSRATDDSGNIEKPAPGISVLAAAHDCPCSIWTSSTTPGVVDSGDGSSGEFGVKFVADYDGYITGIRFYKGSTNTGTHIGHLWSSTGALLASATFTGESPSGWQQVNFSAPVPVTANTAYVASYFTSSGHYSVDLGYFGTSGVDDPPLHALADGISGTDGVFSYGTTPVFPSSSFGASNYWADVVYLPGSSMPGAPAAMLANPSTLSFTAFLNQPAPAAQTVNVYNEGTGTLNWTASASASWIVLSAVSGSTPASLSVSVNPTGLAAGTYTGTVTITPSGGANGPQKVNVSLTVTGLLLSSNFNDGTMNGWAISPLGLASNWSVINGALQYNGGGHTQVYAGDSSWTDYSVEADIKLATAADFPGGIRGRVNPATGAAYTLWLYPSEGLIKLFKNDTWNIDSGLLQLAQAPVGLTAGSFHHVKMTFAGSQIQVFFDGALAITATDPTNTAGMIALDVSNQVITFDNVLVTSGTVTSNPLTLSAGSLAFTGNFQGANPTPQSIQLGSTTSGVLAWTATSTAPWLAVSPSIGVTPQTLQVSANTAGLAGGTYTGSIQVTSLAAPNSPQSINVTLNVIVPPPAIFASPSSMSFQALAGQPNPPTQALAIQNAGIGSFNWTATTDAPWLSISAASGSTPASISVSANSATLPAGEYTGHVIISATGIPNSPQSIPVTLSVLTQDMAETFTDLANGWLISPLGNAGGWSVSAGTYSYSGIGLSLSCTGNTGWSNYDFDTNIKLANLNNWPGGVRGRVNPSTGAGYAVWLYPASSLAILYRVSQWNINDPALTALAQASVNFDTAAAHDLKMSFRGSQISVFWDGQLLMSTADSTYSSGFVCMDADNQPIGYSNIRVASSVNAATLDAPSPSSLVFSALPGTQPAAQTLNITAGGQSTAWVITSDAPWLQATASSNLTPGTITVSANTSGLGEGTFTGHVTIFAPGATNSPLVIPVTLAVKTAILATTPASLTFFGAAGFNTPSQNIGITNAGTGTLNWTASSDSSWISMSAASGAAPSSIAVSPNITGLPNGSYTGNVTVSSSDVANSPATIPVSLQVGNLGFFDDFSSGLATNWTISPTGNAGGWSVVNGAYTFNGQGPSQSWAGNPSWTDYVMSADFTLASPNNYPGGIRGRVNTATGASYAAWIYPGTGLLRLWRVTQWNIDTDPGLTLLAAPVSIPFDLNTHNLKLAFKGSQISVYYDNALVLQATDATYTQGAIALDVHDQPISFDNVGVITF